ncbi:hypothetical protein [Paraburkholderia sp. A3RO-2L]|jgi:hypothetical protein|uniref:hypothetical protein n=1 Tax=unclassified Paraburkholderia TaxID=2615204 RepID=UPI003DA98AC4
MQTYLSGLSLDSSWTRRESRGTGTWKDGSVPGSVRTVSLYPAHSSKRRPESWFSLLFATPPADPENDDFKDLLEVCVLNERLAEQLYEAVIAGTLQIDFA